MKSPRNIPVKALLNADEFVEFDQECGAADVKHSSQLRALAKAWIAEQKRKREQTYPGRTGNGQKMVMSLPGRLNYGARGQMHMRL